MLELLGKLLPASTRPWRITILRRHQPAEEAYDLNDRRKVRMRRKRRLVLGERLDLYTQTAALQDRLLQRARDTGDPTWVVDAQIAWENFQAAGEDLLRFVPVPGDADQRCACGEARHHTLPEVLEEQLLSIHNA